MKLFLSPIYLLTWYLGALTLRRDDIWIFGEGEGYSYKDNSKYLYEYAARNYPEIRVFWITRSKTIMRNLRSNNLPALRIGTFKCLFFSLIAKYVFISHKPSDVNQIAIKGSTQIWLWHGVMMKYIGLDANNFSKSKHSTIGYLKSTFLRIIFPFTRYKPSYVINTSEYFTEYFISAFGVKKNEVLITGYPRNDRLMEKPVASISQLSFLKVQGKKILYLPTWRNRKWGSTFDPFNDLKLDFGSFVDYLDLTCSTLLVKSHPFDILPLDKSRSERVIDITFFKIELYELLREVDVVITDYSSVYFDYLLLDKPVVLAPFDFEDYMRSSRPLYYDYMSEIVGVKCIDWPMVVEVLKAEEIVTNAKEKFHKYFDGNSSKRIIDLVRKL